MVKLGYERKRGIFEEPFNVAVVSQDARHSLDLLCYNLVAHCPKFPLEVHVDQGCWFDIPLGSAGPHTIKVCACLSCLLTAMSTL